MKDRKVQSRSLAAHPPSDPVGLVAIDIDGTLLDSQKRLSKAAVKAVEQAAAAGVYIVLASARPPRSALQVHEALHLDTWVINYNGALIYNPVTRRNVLHRPVASPLAKRIVAAARRADSKVMVSLEILDKWYTDHYDPDLPTQTSLQFEPDFIGPLDAFLRVAVTKIMFLAPPRRLAKVKKLIETKFAGKVNVAVSDAHLIQVTHPQADKAIALARVAAHYKVLPEHVMAVGDAPNDEAMLRWAGLGVAVANAWPQAKNAADVTVASNEDDGVVEAIEKFVLRR